jgi:hypothetical protein
MYALVSVLFSDADNRVGGTGQAHTVYGAASVIKAQTKAGGLRGAGAIRYWLDHARPSRAPQSHVGVAGQNEVQRG